MRLLNGLPRRDAAPTTLPFWRRKAMKDMTPAEWESLCDGCGRCCLNKLQEEGSDRTYYTDVGCKLLDGQTCRCTDYANRSAKVKDCVTLTSRNINRISWLPPTCGYKLVAAGKDLYWWHPLVSGDPETVHQAGRVGARQGRRERGRCDGQGSGGSHRELAAEVAEGREGLGAVARKSGRRTGKPKGRGDAGAPWHRAATAG